ncbi:MAG: rhodanese-like domain-containing protein [bacterium]
MNLVTIKILGAQCIGPAGVDKRIDVIATAIRAGMTVYDLEQLELSYAPPSGSAKDPVNMAGFVGSNILKGLINMVTYDQIEKIRNPFLMEVRSQKEFMRGSIPEAVNIPVDEIRSRMNELSRDRHIIIICQVCIRSYIAFRILKQSGFEQVSSLSGGYVTYCHCAAKVPTDSNCYSGHSLPGSSLIGNDEKLLTFFTHNPLFIKFLLIETRSSPKVLFTTVSPFSRMLCPPLFCHFEELLIPKNDGRMR